MWKKIKQHPYFICYFVVTFLTFSEYIIVNAFSWASFAGFGFGNLEYSKAGITAYHICISIPFFTGFILFIAGSITLYRRKEAFIKYFLYIVTAISGIGTGIIVSLFDDSLGIWYYAGGGILIKMIRAMKWMEFPK